MDLDQLHSALQLAEEPGTRDAAVLIPLIDTPSGLQVLLEVRAQTLAV